MSEETKYVSYGQSINHISGNLVKDPEVKKFDKDGVQHCLVKLTVAVTQNTGKAKTSTDYYVCNLWSNKGMQLINYAVDVLKLKKGDQVGVVGKFSIVPYTDENGALKSVTPTINDVFSVFLEKRKFVKREEGSTSVSSTDLGVSDDEIPF